MNNEFVLRDEISVRAPVERCFQLSTSLALVELDLSMRPVRGRTSGLVVGGDSVRWQGWKFGLPQIHESLIDRFEPPLFFRDRMTSGRFTAFEHDHSFAIQGDGSVLMRDEVRFALPLRHLGILAGKYILAPHISSLLRNRLSRIKRLAEGDGWRSYLPSA